MSLSNNKAATKISKKMCYILRHDPASVNITMDNHGWVDINKLAQALGLGPQHIVMISACDEKNRYEVLDGKVRARQGHSIPVDPGLVECTQPPAKLYHGTDNDNIQSIMEQGLTPQSRMYVHLSANIDTALQVASRRKAAVPVIIEIDTATELALGTKFYLASNGVYHADKITPASMVANYDYIQN